MGKPLRAIICEDDDHDFALLLRELQRGGFDVDSERVQTLEALGAALSRPPWDIVISDYSMPAMLAPQALALVKERAPDLPFIIVSATVGEEVAVEAIRAGARDFMSKNKLTRLVPALERELRDAAVRAENAAMQKQLQVAERMVSVGTMAAGVAHEINNPLAALMANLDFFAEDLRRLREALGRGVNQHELISALDELEVPLGEASECAARVRDIVRDLKIFSRGSDEEQGSVELVPVLESAIRMATNEIRHRARLVTDFEPVPPVEGNEGRLGQVFLNLLVNAAHAVPEGRAADNEIRVTVRHDHRGVVVGVSDTGTGISPGVLSKVFDPFFTTKPFGEGMGLGLAISHRIVTHLGGQIAVKTEPAREEERAGPGSRRTPQPHPRHRRRSLHRDGRAPHAVEGTRGHHHHQRPRRAPAAEGRTLRRHPLRPDDARHDRHGPPCRARNRVP